MILARAPRDPTLPGPPLLEALHEPAGRAGLDGAILAANGAWREALGRARRLPAEWNLYLALGRARAEGRAEVPVPADERRATIAMAGERLFLGRRGTPPPAPLRLGGPGPPGPAGGSPLRTPPDPRPGPV